MLDVALSTVAGLGGGAAERSPPVAHPHTSAASATGSQRAVVTPTRVRGHGARCTETFGPTRVFLRILLTLVGVWKEFEADVEWN